jgi:hypothetical protein
MLALTDARLQIVMATAAAVLPDRRSLFLERCATMLTLQGRFDDSDVANVAKWAACGLIQSTSNAA